jgi:hypothetical protein
MPTTAYSSPFDEPSITAPRPFRFTPHTDPPEPEVHVSLNVPFDFAAAIALVNARLDHITDELADIKKKLLARKRKRKK